MTQFLNAAEEKLPERGIFFSGPFGVGKTYLLGVIANRLKQFNISSMLIYMPEFVREMNASIKDNTVQQKVDRSEEHTSELQSRFDLVCRLLLEKKKKNKLIYL